MMTGPSKTHVGIASKFRNKSKYERPYPHADAQKNEKNRAQIK